MPGIRPRLGLLTAWASRANGGVFEAVVSQAAIAEAAGFAPHVFALHDESAPADRHRFGAFPVTTVPVRGPRAVGWAPSLVSALLAAELDLLHLHGIWMYPSAAAARWAGLTGRPYLISPHGMLDPWITGRGRAKKAVARLGYERRSWRRATQFHALTAAEAADIWRETGRDEIAVVPNAVKAGERRGAAARSPSILYLGRIHPKKNLDALIDGWRQAADAVRVAGARLLIAGWGDEGEVDRLRAMVAAMPDDLGVTFLGPVYGERKAALIGTARFMALPSHSEGLPVAILEAWAQGTPTLMSRHCNLPQGFSAGAAIDCGTDGAAIAAALRKALAMPDDRWTAMSAAAGGVIDQEFSYAHVIGQWREVYGAREGGVLDHAAPVAIFS